MVTVDADSSSTVPFRIAVSGGGHCDARIAAQAEEVGRWIANAGAILVCGGLGGVMEAAARGAAQAGGTTIGVLPGARANEASRWITIPLATAMGEARNVLVVRFADAVIAIGGEWGTLSEIALAKKVGTPVVLLEPTLAATLGIEIASSPAEAVRTALSLARKARGPWTDSPASP